MPLNPKLYNALRRLFPDGVKIQKEGEAMRYRVVKNPMTQKNQINVTSGGEDYKMCCPFCNDTRFRFEVSHRWNTTDPGTKAYFGASFIHCYNDGCDANIDAPFKRRVICHEELVEMVKAYVARGRGLVTKAPREEGAIVKAKLPDKCVPLESLDPGHPAIRYIEDPPPNGRGLSVAKVVNDWRLMFCFDDPNAQVAGRIIIPFYYEGMLVGWQARYVGEPQTKDIPKYYTMPRTPKNRTLYNYDRAKHYPFGVIVEGVTDVWNVGPMGVATLGSSISIRQLQLATMAWSDHGLVAMYDPDFINAKPRRPGEPPPYQRVRERLLSDPTAFKHGVLEVELPGGTDPGSLPTGTIWQIIEQAAAARGFPLRRD